MVTILLQQILDLLKGFFGNFTAWAADVFEKLGLIQEQTENLDDILIDTNNISANSNRIASSNEHIKLNAIQINNKLATIQTNSTTIANNSGSIATSAGTAAAFAEDCATNGLNILDKVTTIASDTTQMRADNAVVKSDLDKIYDAIKWSLINVEISETEEGNSPLIFDTDKADNLLGLTFELKMTETGSGAKSPSNPYTIKGISTFSYAVNTTAEAVLISLLVGNAVYNGVLDPISGSLTVYSGEVANMALLNWQYQSAYSRFVTTDINSVVKRTVDNNEILSGLTCPIYETSSANRTAIASYDDMIGVSSSGLLTLRDTSLNGDLTDLANRLSGQKLVYPLAIPAVYNLTPETFTTLIGLNSISSNGNGKITVAYKESAKHYLDKQEV